MISTFTPSLPATSRTFPKTSAPDPKAADRFQAQAHRLFDLHDTLDHTAEKLFFPGIEAGAIGTPVLGAGGLLAAGLHGGLVGLTAGCALTGAAVLGALGLGNAADYVATWASDKSCQADLARGTVPDLGLPVHTLRSPSGEVMNLCADREVGSAHITFPAGDQQVELFSRNAHVRWDGQHIGKDAFHVEARDVNNERYVLDGTVGSLNHEDPYFRGQITVKGPHGYVNVFEAKPPY